MAENDYYGDQKDYSGDRTGTSNIFVSGLKGSLTKEALENLFKTHFTPQDIVYKPGSEWAIVKYDNVREAELVIRTLNGAPPYNLRVTFSKPKLPKPAELTNTTPVEPLTQFQVEELQPRVPKNMGRGRRLLADAAVAFPPGDGDDIPRPNADYKLLQEKPHYYGDQSFSVKGRGGYTRSPLNRKTEYSTEPVVFGGMSEADAWPIDNCKVCGLMTGLMCETCAAYLCSLDCSRAHHPDCKIKA